MTIYIYCVTSVHRYEARAEKWEKILGNSEPSNTCSKILSGELYETVDTLNTHVVRHATWTVAYNPMVELCGVALIAQ